MTDFALRQQASIKLDEFTMSLSGKLPIVYDVLPIPGKPTHVQGKSAEKRDPC